MSSKRWKSERNRKRSCIILHGQWATQAIGWWQQLSSHSGRFLFIETSFWGRVNDYFIAVVKDHLIEDIEVFKIIFQQPCGPWSQKVYKSSIRTIHEEPRKAAKRMSISLKVFLSQHIAWKSNTLKIEHSQIHQIQWSEPAQHSHQLAKGTVMAVDRWMRF